MEFTSVDEIISNALKDGKKISEVVLLATALDLEVSEEEVFEKMREDYKVMLTSIESGLDRSLKSASGLVGGNAAKIKDRSDSGKGISGKFMECIAESALAVAEYNACMGKIVAAPTAGSSGIIPACLYTCQKFYDIPEDKIVKGLINASGIGMVIARNASISGAEGGCQAECGSAAAMAASAVVELFGGSPKQCGDAVAHALKSLMGLVCDPVAGLVEEPCIIRNVSSAGVAVISAELALSGVGSIIGPDEVIEAMNKVGRCMPESLRETANGGIAASKTAKKIGHDLMSS